MRRFATPGGRSALAVLATLWIAGCGDNTADAPASATADIAEHHAPGAPAPGSDDICNAPAASTVVIAVPPGGTTGAVPHNVKIHYNRPDGQYAGWGLHLWQINDAGQFIADYPGVAWTQPLAPAGFDSFGPFFQVEAGKFTSAEAAGFGFIVHQGDSKDPDGDRLWRFSDGGEFWLKSGDATVFRSNPIGGTLDIATVRVHYQRFDANYAVWGLHLWSTSGIDVARLPGLRIEDFGQPVPLSAMPGFAALPDGSEVAFDLPVRNPHADPSQTSVEFIIHGMPDNPNGGVNNKDGWSSNIHVNYAGLSITDQVGEIWLVQETPQVFTSIPNTKSTSTSDAHAVWLSRSLLRWPRVDTAGAFRLYHAATGQIVARPGAPVAGADGALPLAVFTGDLPAPIAQRFQFVSAGVTLALADEAALDAVIASQLVVVQEDASGNVLGATTAQLAGLLDDRFAAAAAVPDLGASPGHGRTAWKVWAPTAQHVTLCTYAPHGSAAELSVPMTRDAATGVWSQTLPGDHTGQYYRYAVEVFVRGVGVVHNLVTDPYSISLDANSQHSYIADLEAPSLKPPGWDHQAIPRTVQQQEDMTIYELHVRDFSANDATVPATHRGKFLAFTDRASAGMQHLRGLAHAGLTDVHLLPVFDLATVPELGCVTPAIPNAGPDSEAQQAAIGLVRDQDCFNWGYDPYHYTAPEGSFATDPTDGASRIREMRAMVLALHQAGLRVGMDVVYNHTTASGQSDRAVLDRIVPGYYHRLDASGNVETSTCCQNTAAENLMMGKLMIESVVTWATQYKIDSFRFDLMSFHPRTTMEQLKAAVDAATGRSIFLLGEGWNFGEVANSARFVQASQLSLGGSGIATFSDRARDFVRGGGPFDGGQSLVQNQGFINGLYYDDNGSGGGKTRGDLMRAADIVKVGLAGSIRDYRLVTSSDQTLALSQLDYNGQPAGYVSDPQEVVNYVENHDNQTLFDNNAYKLPLSTSTEDRARVQLLGAALDAFSQGIAYFHAGVDTLRSKSMDQNSFNSGDWFNRLDWSYQDNNFGAGAPQQGDNGGNWPIIKPLLANPAIRPTPADIRWTRDAFRDLLEIRASEPLLHLRTAADIQQRLVFYNTGSQQEPTVIAGHLDGRGYPQAGADDLLYLVNVDKVAHTLTIDAEKQKPYHLHPVQRRFDAADHRPATGARYDRSTGAFTVPPRTAVVFVTDQDHRD
ncbi:MAG TPA: alpha-1,6-glucosidase domain-containing protein [Kofleriaceae bacterium]|nr:alpha-1,6-glucosidase domain-containing protein [Kofleriaceae bacterium]